MQTTIQVPITTAPNVSTIVGAVIAVFVLFVILGIISWRKKIHCKIYRPLCTTFTMIMFTSKNKVLCTLEYN